MNKETKSFGASVDSLEPIRTFISDKCNEAGIDKKKSYGLCLAVDEIATNIIKYGYAQAELSEGEGKIEVTIYHDDNQLEVVLEDAGVAFDPLQRKLPDESDINMPLEERPIGGLGIMIAQQSVDAFKYEYVNNRNQNIFIINLS